MEYAVRISGRIRLALYLACALFVSCVVVLAAAPFDTAFMGRTVVFLYAAGQDGKQDINSPLGTGFLLRVPHLHDDKVALLLVTARHIFDPEWVHCPGKLNPTVLFARVNTAPGSTEKVRYIRISLSDAGKPTWFKHQKDDIDAAVISWPITEEDLIKSDTRYLPVWRLPTKEDLGKVSIGDDIVSAGMLVDLRRTTKNYPVFKFGKVSNILGARPRIANLEGYTGALRVARISGGTGGPGVESTRFAQRALSKANLTQNDAPSFVAATMCAY